ncbi:two-component system, chemotaxis family, sensor kinase CheA [Halobacillus karajensis]|uniref:chemotaxis protein CheA n=1 Tax=Halobacillus karajensis TaxID=195088 RepID=UPI0008A7EB17|nr:chemotaxis protein CheA [Halobacillus karajensis]SEH73244.1 two-component system, chemotaxis family, sensor kinase CheA [Halobacillus karajensis]
METKQYLEVFIDESNEHLQSINDQLLSLEKNPGDLTIVNEIFRSAHTLKGMSATMGYQDLSNLTHKMENVLDAVRNEKIRVDENMLDVVFDSVDDLESMVLDISKGGTGERNVEKVVELLQTIENGGSVSSVDQKETIGTGDAHGAGEFYVDEFTKTALQQSSEQGKSNFQIDVSLREDCLLKAARVYMVFEVLEQAGDVILSSPSVEKLEKEEFGTTFQVLLITDEDPDEIENQVRKVSEIEHVRVQNYVIPVRKQETSEQESSVTGNVSKKMKESKKDRESKQVAGKTIRINIDRLDALMNLFEELVIDRGRLEQISNDLKHHELRETVERMTRISNDMQNIILHMRMVPVEQVFNRFPRMVRQLSKDLNKSIDLSIVGAETELDRTVIDEIGDPLVHLIRNALDHGIESPDQRISKGKSATGKLELKAYHSGNHVFIEISDDGGGIDRDKVIQKAIGNRVVTKEQAEAMPNSQVYELIMESGFSTADEISDVSGRGVGLDVVKSTIESLGGNISVDSIPDEGSIFSIQLPLTLSILSVMLVDVQKEKYAIPLSSIIETAIVKKEDIMHAHNKKVIDFRGKIVPLVFLKDVLQVPEKWDEEGDYSVVVVRKGEKMAALVVNSFIGQQEVVLKSLGDYLSGAFAISGATILGDGQVALILDSHALVK